MKSDKEEYYDLSLYTLTHTDPAFIHQNIVDAFAAQSADENTKPMKLAFALIGLYLNLERGFTGKEVQGAHMYLARYRKKWPIFKLPQKRGAITVSDVLAASAGPLRDEMIHNWCVSVWEAYGEEHKRVVALVKTELS